MSGVTLQSEQADAACRYNAAPDPSAEDSNGFVSALYAGGDSRMALDPRTGLNKYLCPVLPTLDLVCASSCTASPVSMRGFERAAGVFAEIINATSERQRALRLQTLNHRIKLRLTEYFGTADLAEVILCPSGTDAMLTAAMLVAAEQPDEAITAILPSASETGTGVPMAVMCRLFDGPRGGTPLIERQATVVEVPVRSADGSPCCEHDVNHAFAATKAAVKGRAIVYLTHGTKTGLIAPVSPPPGADVIVDACQARMEPGTIVAYLRRGWPVVVTGSKFFGGPAFSGAVMFPRARPASGYRPIQFETCDAASLGTALRWTAAIEEIDAFEPLVAVMAGVLSERAKAIESALESNPALVPIGGLRSRGPGWADHPSIFTFAVRDPTNRERLLSAAELRPLYECLARRGILLGQAVGLGRFGGLRIAIGARDLLGDPRGVGLTHVLATLTKATAPSGRFADGGTLRARAR